MAEMRFYHHQGSSLDAVLPALIEKSLERGWRVIVQTATQERLEALDQHLWVYRDDSFLPHGTDREREPGLQPVLLTLSSDNLNAAQVRFLVDGAPMPEHPADYLRVVVMVGGDPEAVAAARQYWMSAKERNLDVSYWQTDGIGRWQRKA
jgi:DNA polymerase-3 subunit chi